MAWIAPSNKGDVGRSHHLGRLQAGLGCGLVLTLEGLKGTAPVMSVVNTLREEMEL